MALLCANSVVSACGSAASNSYSSLLFGDKWPCARPAPVALYSITRSQKCISGRFASPGGGNAPSIPSKTKVAESAPKWTPVPLFYLWSFRFGDGIGLPIKLPAYRASVCAKCGRISRRSTLCLEHPAVTRSTLSKNICCIHVPTKGRRLLKKKVQLPNI